jgi:hypothetical protein
MTLTVCASGCRHTDPGSAFSAVIGCETDAIRNITISIADRTYTGTNQIYTNNCLGKFVQFIGNRTNSAAVI